MTDLVSTIREALEFHREHAGDPSVSWHDETVTQWLSQAADEIERLRGLNHAQHYEYERLERRIASLRHEANTLREALEDAGYVVEAATKTEIDQDGMATECLKDIKKALANAQEDE